MQYASLSTTTSTSLSTTPIPSAMLRKTRLRLGCYVVFTEILLMGAVLIEDPNEVSL